MGKKAFIVLALGFLAALLSAAPARAELNVNINVGPPPPPPVVLAAPPRVVVVPGSPVYYAPEASFNVFVFEGRYYSFHNGAWFVASSYQAPWTMIAVERVPPPLIAVPVKYYKIPPGHAKKMGGGHCPPGLAKQGRC
ncbi:MAG TPA: hypothetical protein VFN71_09380 [Methylomirabilota bacterium]|nr:hypothetical protein [Methylomirabilota bacterium]